MDGSQAIAAGAALSAFGLDAQHDRLLRLDFPRDDGPEAILLPNRLTAHEEISRCFRFEVELLSDDARIPLKAMMARMVTIALVREDGSLRYFNGYVTEFSFLRADGGFAFYRMVLEPWLAFAKLRKDNVSFHGKKNRRDRNPFKSIHAYAAMLVAPFVLVLNRVLTPLFGDGHGIFLVLVFFSVPILLFGVEILVQTIILMIYYPIKLERETGKPVLMRDW